MKTICFKQRYVEPILQGSKSDTVRRLNKITPRPGEKVRFSVGPRPAFAEALVDHVIPADGLSQERQQEVIDCLGEMPEDALLISFTITDKLE